VPGEGLVEPVELVASAGASGRTLKTCGARAGSSCVFSASSIRSAPNELSSSVSVVVAYISSCSRAPAAVVMASHIDPSGCDSTSSRLNACGLCPSSPSASAVRIS
jgi:hypothetical protein